MTANKTYRVLIADDSTFAQRMVTRALEGTEFEIVGHAATDDEAVERFKDLLPDLVLLDVIMPKTGGLEALRRIRVVNPKATVIMLSSLGTEDTVSQCLKQGARTFVNKPFENEALLACIRKTLGA